MDIKTDVSVSAILDLAADLMQEHGWIQGEYWAEQTYSTIITDDAEYRGGAMCTEGAIRAASTIIYGKARREDGRLALTTLRDETRRAFEAVADIVGGGSMWTIPAWNDETCCSQEQAVSVLRDAATKTRPDSLAA